ncbi:3-methyl-2-oxobutanoate hydroxymethyltransferase [Pseudosulfitobacter pseudonitzschiae]|uniref:3-methyl-2-oxobutanoate hydroxymethyltransferase n=1 Tax=Pseudosulfitobacter pseudonitzschiae TaxID=1402135 RepID=UPI001AFA7654|nr:3-methyl-2-oxobutanoate hydroxymethyltransferase [Pseudosulfitobacter pseudonitzschiae]MBM1816163.1 3-methyl-2-oxobutanoate hydroxymethyltransferase [Pseudosulfitobacter pseudonitzschiae]MBM1833469.1 3-methyl-2-oxobutanoate hydroxymethyltransferase [Pseudosulfitobacter pseudonitzschiae]MBM1838336.1 3-methyl-2-oxobutanoate hydroxymethyltransferase [Pseudosulfitobacter pseudonitzschiae]MBM1842868.1 3-methyl-2-oxobutanoate hydroxymethyltransferase [Pseudosulfitobacter pseudonitzschiae]MBM18477
MSTSRPLKALDAAAIRARKGGTPLVCLTAYTTPVARIADTQCDLVLVGDSVGMVLHGMASTLSVTMEMMVLHGQAVARGLERALMVVDMPFGSYEESPQQALRNAVRIMAETGAGAVKLEGGRHMAETIGFLVQRGIPVMGHVGLTPQSVNTLGGYRVQGKGDDAARIRDDARAVSEAGAFSVVLEKVPAALSDQITAEIDIPTVGIGASAGCDGQILVIDDMLGLFADFKPRFVKRYADLAGDATAAVQAYAEEVRARQFPAAEHVFTDAGAT